MDAPKASAALDKCQEVVGKKHVRPAHAKLWAIEVGGARVGQFGEVIETVWFPPGIEKLHELRRNALHIPARFSQPCPAQSFASASGDEASGKARQNRVKMQTPIVATFQLQPPLQRAHVHAERHCDVL